MDYLHISLCELSDYMRSRTYSDQDLNPGVTDLWPTVLPFRPQMYVVHFSISNVTVTETCLCGIIWTQ